MVECPKCKWKLSWIRFPKSMREFLWGGWTCPNCGAKIDRAGNLLTSNKNSKNSAR